MFNIINVNLKISAVWWLRSWPLWGFCHNYDSWWYKKANWAIDIGEATGFSNLNYLILGDFVLHRMKA